MQLKISILSACGVRAEEEEEEEEAALLPVS